MRISKLLILNICLFVFNCTAHATLHSNQHKQWQVEPRESLYKLIYKSNGKIYPHAHYQEPTEKAP